MNLNFFERARIECVPVFSAGYAEQFFGGLIHRKTLYQHRWTKTGPPNVKINNKIAYERESFIDWLESTVKQ